MKKGQPSVREMVAVLREQDRVIEALVGLCEEQRALIDQLSNPPVEVVVQTVNSLNGWRH